MRPIDVPQTAILAALGALAEFEKRPEQNLAEHHVAAMIAAAVTDTIAEKSAEERAEWLATTIAQREHAEIAIRAIHHQTDLIQQILNQMEGSGEPSEYEVWRDAIGLAVTERSYIDEDGITRSGLLARARWFHTELNLGPQVSEPEDQPACVVGDCGCAPEAMRGCSGYSADAERIDGPE